MIYAYFRVGFYNASVRVVKEGPVLSLVQDVDSRRDCITLQMEELQWIERAPTKFMLFYEIVSD